MNLVKRNAEGRADLKPEQSTRLTRGGLTLAELLVVLGIISLLLALLLPAISKAREKSLAIYCASNLRQLGVAMSSYAADNDGFVPRGHTFGRVDHPPWMLVLARYLTDEPTWARSRESAAVVHRLMTETEALRCRSHPLDGEIPSAFVINAFSFETQPRWNESGPVKLALVKNTSQVILLAEAATYFGESRPDFQDRFNHVFFPQYHDVWHPGHLPRGQWERVAEDRHAGRANTLMFDTSVQTIGPGQITLEMFDDGLSRRGRSSR